MEFILSIKSNLNAAGFVWRLPRIKMSVAWKNPAIFDRMTPHIRRDVGIDDAHRRTQADLNDPFEVEIRRLNTRL